MVRRIGILGGSFDPVHKGHLSLAKCAFRELDLDRVYFVPAKISPLKSGVPAPVPRRMEMLRMALKKFPSFKVSRIEIKRKGPSYTIHTLQTFKRKFKKSGLFLIMGSDSLKSFKTWKDWRKILRLCTLLVGARPGDRIRRPTLLPGSLNKIVWLKHKMIRVSSTHIRKRIQKGDPIHSLVQPAVAGHINRYGLYHG